MKKNYLFLLLMSFSLIMEAKVAKHQLYINRGKLITKFDDVLECLAFNNTPTFDPKNAVIKSKVDEQIILEIINNDSQKHQLNYTLNGSSDNIMLDINGKAEIQLTYKEEGIFPIFDDFEFPKNYYLGLSTMICVGKKDSDSEFFWNLKEHQIDFVNSLAENKSVDWSNYAPEFFSINNASFPAIHDDTTAKIYGKVGDTIRIYILNSGMSLHSIHFHGFHCKVTHSKNDFFNNTSKDTFPLKAQDYMVLEMIPDKKGEYAVHDHNLMATTSKLRHPSGMMLMMLIE